MKISTPKLISDGDRVKISSVIEYAGGEEELWYSVDREYADFLTIETLGLVQK